MNQIGVMIFEGQALPSGGVLTTTQAPALVGLESSYWYYSNYTGTAQPSLPDYCMLTSGSWLNKASAGVAGDDNGPYGFAGTHANIFTQVANAGGTWKCYGEGETGNFGRWTAGTTGVFNDPNSAGTQRNYIAHHNPAEIYTTTIQGVSHGSGAYDFDELNRDIIQQSLPNFFWISPNGWADGHDSGQTTPIKPDLWITAQNPEQEAQTVAGSATLATSITPGTIVFTATNANTQGYPTGIFQARLGTTEQVIATRSAGSDIINILQRGYANTIPTAFSSGTVFSHYSANFVFPGLTALLAAMQPDGLLFITFDNHGSAANAGIIYHLCCGPSVTAHPGGNISTAYTHANTLKAIQSYLGLSPWTSGVETIYTNATALEIPSITATPTRTVSPTSVTFANTDPGSTSSPAAVSVENTGSGTLSGSVSLGGLNPGKFAITEATKTYSLTNLTSSTFHVTFHPLSTDARGTTFSANLVFTDNATGSPFNVGLSGQVIPAGGNAVVSPTTMSFSVQAGFSSTPQTIKVTNTGGADLTINP